MTHVYCSSACLLLLFKVITDLLISSIHLYYVCVCVCVILHRYILYSLQGGAKGAVALPISYIYAVYKMFLEYKLHLNLDRKKKCILPQLGFILRAHLIECVFLGNGPSFYLTLLFIVLLYYVSLSMYLYFMTLHLTNRPIKIIFFFLQKL